MSLKDNKYIYKVGHSLNLFRLRFRFIPYTFKYIFTDINLELHNNDRDSSEKYLIFQRVDYTGLMTHVFFVMGWVKYSLENGFTLLVDTSIGENPYLEDNENTWELYYQQPMIDESVDNAFIERIKRDKNYSFAPYNNRESLTYVKYVPRWLIKSFRPQIHFPQNIDFVKDESALKYWEGIYDKYIKLQPEVQKYVDQEYDEILKDSGKVLGVLIRGSGYRKAKPYNHHIQPEMEDVIEKINEFQEKYGWDYIYLATEEEKYEKQLKELYPGKILTNKREYDEENSVRSGHQAGLEYLSSMYLLSRCDMLIAGLCGGSQAAILMNQHQYTHLYVFDIGKYQ